MKGLASNSRKAWEHDGGELARMMALRGARES